MWHPGCAAPPPPAMGTSNRQVFRCLRCLILQMASTRLAPLWPAVMTELANVFDTAATQAAAPVAPVGVTAPVPTAPSSAGLPGVLVAAAVTTADAVASVASAVVAPVASLVAASEIGAAGSEARNAVQTPAQLLAACQFVDLALCVAPDDMQL